MKQKPKVQEGQIEKTFEYSVFERLPGNRPIDEAHVRNLMQRMRKKYMMSPIQINQNFQVIDGQHRLEAHRRLGLEVPYFVCNNYGLEEVQELNAQQKKWKIADFVKSYIELGNKNYEIYEWFISRYKLPHTITVSMLSGVHRESNRANMRTTFESGYFKVTDLQGAKDIAEKLWQIEPYFSHWNNRGFVSAMLFCFQKKAFDFDKFLQKLEANPLMLKQCATTVMYIKLIEEIYNFRSRDKVSLQYGENK